MSVTDFGAVFSNWTSCAIIALKPAPAASLKQKKSSARRASLAALLALGHCLLSLPLALSQLKLEAECRFSNGILLQESLLRSNSHWNGSQIVNQIFIDDIPLIYICFISANKGHPA